MTLDLRRATHFVAVGGADGGQTTMVIILILKKGVKINQFSILPKDSHPQNQNIKTATTPLWTKNSIGEMRMLVGLSERYGDMSRYVTLYVIKRVGVFGLDGER